MSGASATEPTVPTDDGQQFPFRAAAALELALAAMLIVGSYPYIPFATTVVLLLLATISLWLRRSGWRALGLRRPRRWTKTLAAGILIGAAAQAFDLTVITPLLTRLSGHPPDVSLFRNLAGNVPQLFFWLGVSWTSAAFGEEMIYRGYLLNRAADLVGRTRIGWVAAAVISSALFALGHRYQGWIGMIDIGFNALIPVVAYLASGRNLWIPILLHGTGDSIGFILIFLRHYPGI